MHSLWLALIRGQGGAPGIVEERGEPHCALIGDVPRARPNARPSAYTYSYIADVKLRLVGSGVVAVHAKDRSGDVC